MREVVLTVTDPRVNGGLPSNIPILQVGGRPTRAQIEAAILDAAQMIAAGSLDFPVFDSIEEAVATAQLSGRAPITAAPTAVPLAPSGSLAAGYNPGALDGSPGRATGPPMRDEEASALRGQSKEVEAIDREITAARSLAAGNPGAQTVLRELVKERAALVASDDESRNMQAQAALRKLAEEEAAGADSKPGVRLLKDVPQKNVVVRMGDREPAPMSPDGRYLYFSGDPQRTGFYWFEANPAPGTYYRIVHGPEGANQALLEGDLPLLGSRHMAEMPIEDAMPVIRRSQYDWYERPHAPLRNAAERLRRGLPPRGMESAFAPTLEPRWDVETPGHVPSVADAGSMMSVLFGVPLEEILQDYRGALQRQHDAQEQGARGPEPRGPEESGLPPSLSRSADSHVPDEAATSFTRGASGYIPLRHALPMLMREPVGGAAAAPALDASPGGSLAAGYSPAALEAATTRSTPGGRPIVPAPFTIPQPLKPSSEDASTSDYLRGLPPIRAERYGSTPAGRGIVPAPWPITEIHRKPRGHTRVDFVLRSLKPASEDVSTSDYLRGLPPLAELTPLKKYVDAGGAMAAGGLIPLRVAMPMLLQGTGGQDEADG